MKLRNFLAIGLLAGVMIAAMENKIFAAESADQAAKVFIDNHLAKVRPLEIALSRAWWDANISGSDEAFAKKEELQNQLDALLADPATFTPLKSIKEAHLNDPLLARQIDVLYLAYLEKQIDSELLKRLAAKANAIEKAFNVFRAQLDGKPLADSEVRRLLKEANDSRQRRQVWEASKQVAPLVIADLKELVQLRNQAARKLGFADYHVMQLVLAEQRQADVLALFDELDELTREPFHQLKEEIDTKLAARYGITIDELRPWHYHDPFFQEPPQIFATDLDAVYEKLDVLKLCRDFYAGIGLPVDDILAQSDLYEREGKNPHAFCTDIDRAGDVRVLANIVPGEYWMATMLHELGHGVYSSKYIPAHLPYLLRSEAHILTTEGIAMLFERFAKNADWLQSMGGTVADPQGFNETARRMRRDQLLIFSRWTQVMFRFEKELYANPEQDLNKLWWDLVERYQLVKRPEGRNEPDFASKIHIVSAPAYYHNYMLGQLFACQMHKTVCDEVLGHVDPVEAVYGKDPRIGAFLQQRVFDPGRTLPWNELTRHATGQPLNAKAFAAEFQAK